MKKRLLQVIAFLCVAVTLFSLCACVKQPDNSNDVVAESERAEHKVTNGCTRAWAIFPIQVSRL